MLQPDDDAANAERVDDPVGTTQQKCSKAHERAVAAEVLQVTRYRRRQAAWLSIHSPMVSPEVAENNSPVRSFLREFDTFEASNVSVAPPRHSLR